MGEKEARMINHTGHHDMTEAKMDVDEQLPAAMTKHSEEEEAPVPMHLEAPRTRQSREQSAFDGSFHSAKEDLTRENSKEPRNSLGAEPVPPQARVSEFAEPSMDVQSPQPPEVESRNSKTLDLETADKNSLMDEDIGDDSLRSPSEGSSPATKGLVRKSSLTFATLPAREPLTTKKSIGARLSRTSHVGVSKGIVSRESFLGRITGGKSLGGALQPETAAGLDGNDEMTLDVDGRPQTGHQGPDSEVREIKLHNMSSTQRLHDKISQLGKSQPARPTKSVPAAAIPSHAAYPELSRESTSINNHQRASKEDEDDGDWIQPPSIEAAKSPRPQLSKSISTDVMENLRGKINISDEDFGREQQQSPRRHSLKGRHASPSIASSGQVPLETVASPSKATEAELAISSTTPVGTPVSARLAEGPISASKSKLQSIMKTARGLFTSSAGASAQAKMELRNQAKLGSPNLASPSKPTAGVEHKDLYPSLDMDQTKNPLPIARPENSAKPAEGRRTRASIEKEKKEKERQRSDMEQQKSNEEESRKETRAKQEKPPVGNTVSNKNEENPNASASQPSKTQQQPNRKSPRRLPDAQQNLSGAEMASDIARDAAVNKISQPPPPPAQEPQLQKPKEIKRPIRPAKETIPKPEPQRVAIRVGTLAPHRIPLSNAALSSGLQDSLPPPTNKQPGLSKKTSTASIQTSASTTNLRSTTTSKPKALIAAEKKKEQVRDPFASFPSHNVCRYINDLQDEREAQRKLEQKREIERKRAAQQEETRRQEQAQRREAEKQREHDRAAAAEDPKKMAQRQAIEVRRQELAKKDQQRIASVSQQQAQPNSRPELGGARPPSKLHTVQDYSRPPVNQHPVANPAKAPIKRVFEPEVDESLRQSRLPGVQSYQSNDAKRRRTNDEPPEEPHVRPTMVPPKRQSNLLKVGT